MGRRRQANGCNRILIIFYVNSGTDVGVPLPLKFLMAAGLLSYFLDYFCKNSASVM
jgi:hypothetical protein